MRKRGLHFSHKQKTHRQKAQKQIKKGAAPCRRTITRKKSRGTTPPKMRILSSAGDKTFRHAGRHLARVFLSLHKRRMRGFYNYGKTGKFSKNPSLENIWIGTNRRVFWLISLEFRAPLTFPRLKPQWQTKGRIGKLQRRDRARFSRDFRLSAVFVATVTSMDGL